MCTTPHNPNNVDLGRDVLFSLLNETKAEKDVARIDENVWKYIDEAIEILEKANSETAPDIIHDQIIRLKALRCWFMTSRNLAAWVYGVHGYLSGENNMKREICRETVKELIGMEVENSLKLLELLDDEVEFMALTDKGETPLIHGLNIKANIRKRIKLMQEHADDEPYIDNKFIEKIAGTEQN